ncbi:unnamed protein product, partial [Rotaria magnacalcarata]
MRGWWPSDIVGYLVKSDIL